MKKKYTHLTQEEREQLSVLHARQTTVSEIACRVQFFAPQPG